MKNRWHQTVIPKEPDKLFLPHLEMKSPSRLAVTQGSCLCIKLEQLPSFKAQSPRHYCLPAARKSPPSKHQGNIKTPVHPGPRTLLHTCDVAPLAGRGVGSGFSKGADAPPRSPRSHGAQQQPCTVPTPKQDFGHGTRPWTVELPGQWQKLRQGSAKVCFCFSPHFSNIECKFPSFTTRMK